VLLTGANGRLGRFLALEWLERLSETGGTLITIVRGRDKNDARKRLESVFEAGRSGAPHRAHRRLRHLAGAFRK
jgi:fatty acid CoA ligase FadD9